MTRGGSRATRAKVALEARRTDTTPEKREGEGEEGKEGLNSSLGRAHFFCKVRLKKPSSDRIFERTEKRQQTGVVVVSFTVEEEGLDILLRGRGRETHREGEACRSYWTSKRLWTWACSMQHSIPSTRRQTKMK